ncbi:hypothetical protein EJ04DRAFT_581657 [Polyplosphaeria fusca]|uniref:Uncharacterized protein n=1 Tax=Polyplosphaeria fusca TaxID=682080 RepID=A0A9P4QNG8_9PLEO|nr:hypothetical protein EJ04DRAFT_581657 [Polyplosphaeria fusca]
MLADQFIRIGGYIASLPDDQWVKEIVGWESHTWASLQIAIEKYATGAKSIDPYADSYIKAPETDGEKALCAKQRMKKSGGFVNINVFALSFVYAFSVFIVTMDIVLLRFLIYLSRFRRMRTLGPRIERWIQDGVLQLQRRAFESSRQGTWRSLEKEVPITARRETLEDLPRGEFQRLLKNAGRNCVRSCAGSG